jgi:hypothetical protein
MSKCDYVWCPCCGVLPYTSMSIEECCPWCGCACRPLTDEQWKNYAGRAEHERT